MSAGSMEQTSQPYLHCQCTCKHLRCLRHQLDQKGSTQELPILLQMVEPCVRLLFPFSSSSHTLTSHHSSRSSSAIPGISVSQLSKSCKCLLTGSVGTASTAVKVTTSSTKTTAAATSTLACKKRRKVRRTVTVDVPAEATPSV
jgi:hypothetical protein